MSLLNVIYNPAQFWDGRTDTLEQQALEPLTHPDEMGNRSLAEVLERLRGDAEYRAGFRAAFGENQAIDVLLHEWGHALAWNYSLDRLSRTPGLDPAEFEQASHDEAWGCAYARVWRAHLEGMRQAG